MRRTVKYTKKDIMEMKKIIKGYNRFKRRKRMEKIVRFFIKNGQFFKELFITLGAFSAVVMMVISVIILAG